MKYHPASGGLWVCLALACFAVLSNCLHLGDQVLVLRPSYRPRVFDRSVFLAAVSTPDDENDSPAAYDFGSPDDFTTSTAAYPLPTSTSDGADEPSYDPNSTRTGRSSTATTEPRSPGISNGSEIESTSTAVTQEPSTGETLSPIVTTLFDSSADAASQTDAHRDETVTVTVTNFVSSEPTRTGTRVASPSSGPQTSFNASTSSIVSDSDFSVITITSLQTITLSINRTSSTVERTASSVSGSPANSTSTSETTPSQNSTSAGPVNSSGASIITITRTETHTDTSNTTADATESVTSKEVATSTIEWPTPISRIPPFSASFNLSSVTGPVLSSDVSGAVTSLQSTSPSGTTHTVFQNITVTLTDRPETASRETDATRTQVPTNTRSSNATSVASSTQTPSSLSDTTSTANATVSETPVVSISTHVVTITVYPTASEITSSANETSVVTLHSSSTTTVTITPYPLSNASSSAFPTAGGLTTVSGGVLNTGGTDGWSTSLSTVSTNTSVIGTLLNSTTTWASTDDTQPTYVDTTCKHTQTVSESAYATSESAATSSSPASTSSNVTVTVTVTYPAPSTFRTTVSPTSSGEDDWTSAYPSPSGKRMPGSPSYPWGGSGPLHRVQEPDF